MLRTLGALALAGLLSAPLAAVWAVSHTTVTDFLGPQRSQFSTNFSGEVDLDLGPLGNAYLPQSFGPVGVRVEVGGLEGGLGGSTGGAGTAMPGLNAETLDSYTLLYTDPDQTIRGVRDRLSDALVTNAVRAELVLVGLALVWRLRRYYLSPRLVEATRRPRSWIGYGTLVLVVVASTLRPVPADPEQVRYPVSVADGTRFAGLAVDSPLLADLLDRGIHGIRVLADRQLAAIQDYIVTASASFTKQSSRLATPQPGESRIVGFSDLHCSIAMTEVIRRVVSYADPVQVFSSGDDTMNGTAVERACVAKEREIAAQRPFIDIRGNHDSPTTAEQMARVGAIGLTGRVADVGGVRYLGDGDPEYNLPFSLTRIQVRNETEQQMGQRLLNTAAGRDVDMMLVHQPLAAQPIVTAPNPPAKLVAWGHMHVQAGPTVIPHTDGSWTVALQQGTAGGIAQPIITSFSTPFSPPRKQADVYVYFRDDATGLITGVQPIHFLPDGSCIVDRRITTGDVSALPESTRRRLGAEQQGSGQAGQAGGQASGEAAPSGSATPDDGVSSSARASASASASNEQTAPPSPLPSATTPGNEGEPEGG